MRQSIKQSEARILIYLSVVHNTRKHVTAIANKLEMDYSYCMRILQEMTAKGWLTKHRYRSHMFYDLAPLAPLTQASEILNGMTNIMQKDLKSTDYDKPAAEGPKPAQDPNYGLQGDNNGS